MDGAAGESEDRTAALSTQWVERTSVEKDASIGGKLAVGAKVAAHHYD